MDLRDKIVKELIKNKEGYTVSELAKKMMVTRNTIAIAFAFLEGGEKIKIRQAGMAKIYYWNSEKRGEK